MTPALKLLALPFVLFFAQCVFSAPPVAKLPDYVIKCKRDPNFEKCGFEVAHKVIPFLLKGDKSLNLPSLSPLNIPEVEVQNGDNFVLKLKDLLIYGIDKAELVEFKGDYETNKYGIKLAIDKLEMIGKYDVKGRVLVLPITGNGDLNITLTGGIFKYDLDGSVEERNGVKYSKILDTRADYTITGAQFDLKNLFNGDKRLGDEMNKFLNENWKDVHADFKQPILKVMKQIIDQISTTLIQSIPYDEFFAH